MEEDNVESLSSWPPETNSQANNTDDVQMQCMDSSYQSNVDASDDIGRSGKRRHLTSRNATVNEGTDILMTSLTSVKVSTIKRPRLENEDFVQEMSAKVSLARWWKQEGRLICDAKDFPDSNNPNTLLKYVARTKEGANFIVREISRLETLILSGASSTDVFAALASYLDMKGDFNAALQHIETAMILEPSEKEYHWFSIKLQQQFAIAKHQQENLTQLQNVYGKGYSVPPEIVAIERKSAKSLSFSEFFFNYAMPGVPVIITDAIENMTTVPWTWSHIKEIAGSKHAQLKRLVPGSVEWAQLENSETKTVCDFMNTLGDRENKQYLFDWNLPFHCPQLSQELVIPKYFAGDFLQRVRLYSLYRDSWPSLFIAPSGLRSELHVDAFGSNFWMALFEGKKRWLIFKREDLPFLYPDYGNGMDPVFDINLDNIDLKSHPLISLTQPKECILHAGELLFVPSGCPHRVENLETSLAISANYVDLSNINFVKKELKTNALRDQRAAELLCQFEDPSFKTTMNHQIKDTPWAEFKKYPKNDFEDYSH